MNMLGQIVQVANFNGSSEVDLSEYPSGQYILQIIQNAVATIKKCIKE